MSGGSDLTDESKLNEWLPEAEFVKAVQALPLVSVDLLVINPAGQILLGLRRNAPARDWWFTPGARVRKNEAFTQTLQRVMSTEVGLLSTQVHVQPKLMAIWDHFYDDSAFNTEVSTHYVNLPHWLKVSRCMCLDDLPSDQHSGWRWQDPQEAALAEDVHPYVRAYAQWLLDRDVFE